MKVEEITRTMTSKASISSQVECCMCGDYGFSYELFQCKICQFRSQHRYCSNLYPKISESPGICNWCLYERSQNSSDSSSSLFKSDDAIKAKVKKESIGFNGGGKQIREKSRAIVRSGQIGPIKKQRSLEAPPAGGRKRIMTAAAKEAAAERLRRTRSEDISGVGIAKQVFRNRVVKRYKLLDEVAS